jgi:hypothetical protein
MLQAWTLVLTINGVETRRTFPMFGALTPAKEFLAITTAGNAGATAWRLDPA